MISQVDNNFIWGMSGVCLGQHLGHIVKNGQQSAVLHVSVMQFFKELYYTPEIAGVFVFLFRLIHRMNEQGISRRKRDILAALQQSGNPVLATCRGTPWCLAQVCQHGS